MLFTLKYRKSSANSYSVSSAPDPTKRPSDTATAPQPAQRGPQQLRDRQDGVPPRLVAVGGLGGGDGPGRHGLIPPAKLVGDITKSLTQITDGLNDSLGVDVKSLVTGFLKNKTISEEKSGE